MNQLPLFKPSAAEPVQAADPEFIRKHLHRLLRMTRDAQQLPWDDYETRGWEELFPQLAQSLPGEEGRNLCAAFAAEILRLRTAA